MKCKNFSALGLFFVIQNIYDKSNPDFLLFSYCCYIPQTLTLLMHHTLIRASCRAIGTGDCPPLWEEKHCFNVQRRPKPCGGRLQNFDVCVKVILSMNTGAGEVSPPKKILLLTPLSHITIFLNV